MRDPIDHSLKFIVSPLMVLALDGYAPGILLNLDRKTIGDRLLDLVPAKLGKRVGRPDAVSAKRTIFVVDVQLQFRDTLVGIGNGRFN